jgi:serine/threonine protein kinase
MQFENIEVMHELGYVYRDIKPDNFVMGIGKRSKELFMVDFGLCKRFRDQNTRLFLPYKESVSMVGTIRYSSLNSHLGIDQTRRDDL